MGSGISRFNTDGWFVAGGTGALGIDVDAAATIVDVEATSGTDGRAASVVLGASIEAPGMYASPAAPASPPVPSSTDVVRAPARIVDDTSTERFARTSTTTATISAMAMAIWSPGRAAVGVGFIDVAGSVVLVEDDRLGQPVEGRFDVFGLLEVDAGHLGDLVDGGALQLRQLAETVDDSQCQRRG